MEKKELAVVENFEMALNSSVSASYQREFGSKRKMPFDIIRIPAGGALVFEVPGEDEDSPETEKELIGIIIDHHCLNAYWSKKYTGEKEVPDCSSIDSNIGIDKQTGEILDCDTCQYNQYGSAEDGVSKACKNMHRLYFLRSGYMIPDIINLPPSSIAAFENYLWKKVVLKGILSNQLVTKISLKKAVNSKGITYSQAVFQSVGKLLETDIQKIEQYSEEIKSRHTSAAETIDRDSFERESCGRQVQKNENQEFEEDKQNRKYANKPAPQMELQFEEPEEEF